jgi:nucleotide-binding universal stress UspA family protein
MSPFKTILYPTDFSDASQPAFGVACELAERYAAHLVVLYVEPVATAAAYEQVMLPDRLDFEVQLMSKLGKVRPANPQVRVEHYLVTGDPALEIVHKAREIPCDLIVMGTHGRTGLRRLVLGSVAEKVVRKAPCPVLTVKPWFVAEPNNIPCSPESEPVESTPSAAGTAVSPS